jgi:hypothetical protein
MMSATSASDTGTRKCLSDSSRPWPEADPNLRDDPLFPDGSGVEPRTYALTADEVIRLSEEGLPFITSWPGFEDERLRSKCRVPFELPD